MWRFDHYAILYLANLPRESIASFRREYDPTVALIDPHVTIVFPVSSEAVQSDVLRQHARDVAARMSPFEIQFRGLEKSWNHWLFLLVDQGREEVVALHDALYRGDLRPHLLTERPYVPHLGLGLFVENGESLKLLDDQPRTLDRARFDRALSEAEAMHLDYRCRFDDVRIVGLDAELSRLATLEVVPLG